MKTVLAAAALSLCLAFAGHAADLRLAAGPGGQAPSCIQHGIVRVTDSLTDRQAQLGCAQFLSTSRVVQSRHAQRT